MQCCNKTKPNEESGAIQGHQHSWGGGIKHMLMMFACCLAPIGVVILLKLSGYEGAASYLVFLICPLMHLFMMRVMGKKQQEIINQDNTTQ